LVIGEQAHDRVGEVTHILGNQESEMTGLDLLVVDDTLTNLVTGPLCIPRVTDRVILADKHGNRDRDVFKRNKVGLTLGLEPLVVGIRPDLESVLPHILRVVQDIFDGGTSWAVG